MAVHTSPQFYPRTQHEYAPLKEKIIQEDGEKAPEDSCKADPEGKLTTRDDAIAEDHQKSLSNYP